MTKSAGRCWPIFTTLTAERKMIFAPPPPPHIHLRSQHTPLINLMGLMTFFKRKFFRHFRPLMAPQKKKIRRLGRQSLPVYHKRDNGVS